MLKSEKGTTLVTLVLAIVVLLALAATVVFLIFGKNGIATENPVVISVQDKNYAETIVKVGLKAVRNEARTTVISTNSTSGIVGTTEQITNADKMNLLVDFLESKNFTKESDTVLLYNVNGNTYRITIDFNSYEIDKIE